MNDKHAKALQLVREALAGYIDTPEDDIQPDTRLVDLQVDSLTLAELLFELEDRVGVSMQDLPKAPASISDVVDLVLPYIDA